MKIDIESREQLRTWLASNHQTSGSVWLVLWKKGSGKPYVSYTDVVDECLCFGWVDSLPAKLDAQRSMLRISPRNPKSKWSGVNKRKVARLECEGRMTDAGRALIRLAKDTGTWTFLDDVEALVLPVDLQEAFEKEPDARAFFERFPDSSKRGILEWIKSARTSPTRARRIGETVDKALRNRKANHPARRDAGSKPAGSQT